MQMSIWYPTVLMWVYANVCSCVWLRLIFRVCTQMCLLSILCLSSIVYVQVCILVYRPALVCVCSCIFFYVVHLSLVYICVYSCMWTPYLSRLCVYVLMSRAICRSCISNKMFLSPSHMPCCLSLTHAWHSSAVSLTRTIWVDTCQLSWKHGRCLAILFRHKG